ncbi:uncharacterized protein EV154DRAFT_518384, partial [Mucor mucedo]|uniref:uncharacterized protein n=1 Tax=Mucor mucedo TaxID=29922 RepID=UPI00221FFC76
METTIEVLRVEQSAISKELSRFRACDTETRSLFCREWAQYIYKKHFVWNAKTQEEFVPEDRISSTTTLTAGKYQINFLATVTQHHHHCDCVSENEHDHGHQDNVFKKERSSLLGKKFEELAASWTSADANNAESLLQQIMTGCQVWMTLPSGYTGLPDAFEPAEFNPYPDAIPLVDDSKDPSQLLDPLIIERQALCLPSDCFHLLKNLTGDILLSHTTPTCQHSKPTAKTPADLEIDRTIVNEHGSKAVTQALKELNIALDNSWYPLNRFLQNLGDLEKKRAHLMGKGCQANIDAYFAGQNYISFVDAWSAVQAQYKNKKSTEEEIKKVDTMFEQHLDKLKSNVKDFISIFVPDVLEEIHTLTNDLWKMVVPTIYELGERMADREASKGSENAVKIDESLKSLDVDYLKKMESTKEVDSAKKRITASLNAKVDEYMVEIDGLFKLYKDTARPNLSGRLEKLNNKDFKKKIKKVESMYYSIRQTFRYEVTEKIFPESLFCKFALVCLEPLLQEGEMVEALTIETEVKRFAVAYKDLWQQRDDLLLKFEQGVQTGRRELAGVLGKLFLKEGMRIQGDNLALKRQNSLLKSMGMEVTEEPKKKSKNKKKSSSGASTPDQQQEPLPSVSSPAKKSPLKKVAPVTPPSEPIKKAPEVVAKKASPEKPTVSVKSLPVSPGPSKTASPVQPVTPKTASVKSLPASPAPPKKTLPISVEQKKPVVEEKKSTVAEKRPVEEKKSTVAEDKPVEEKKTVVTAAAPKKPVVSEVKKPVVPEVKKAVVPEYKKFDNKKPLASDFPTKVKSSKIPAPAPIIEPKVEPKVEYKSSEKKKKTSATPKKKEVSAEKDVTVEKKEVPVEKKEVPVEKEEVLVEKKEAPVEKKEIPVEKKQVVVEKQVVAEMDDLLDFNEIRASVMETNSEAVSQNGWNSKPATQELEVQDWNDLRAQVQLEETQKKAEEPAPSAWTQPAAIETGWSTIAAKKPTVETNWSNTSAATSSETAPTKDTELGSWGTPKKSIVSPALSTVSSAWSTTATVGNDFSNVSSGWSAGHDGGSWNASPAVSAPPGLSAPPTATQKPLSAPPGWGPLSDTVKPSPPPGLSAIPDAPVSQKPNPPPGWGPSTEAPTTEKKISAPPGWGPPSATEQPVVAASSGWGASPVDEKKPTVSAPPGWGNSRAEEKKPAVSAPPGWGVSSVEEKKSAATSPTGWGNSSAAVATEEKKPDVAAPPGWGPLSETPAIKKAAEASTGRWAALTSNIDTEKPSVSRSSGWSSDATSKPSPDVVLGGWGKPTLSSTWAEKKTKTSTPAPKTPAPKTPQTNWNAEESSGDGWNSNNTPWNNEEEPAAAAVVAPPRVNTQTPATLIPVSVTPVSSKPPGLSTPLTSTPVLSVPEVVTSISSFVLPGTQPQLQDPLPNNLDDMAPEMLALVCKNLHRENGSLLQSVYSMQQEMTMMTTRYTEIMSLARERETQNLKLFESRKQTELEDIRRYVLSLEARLKQMEEKSDRVTAGFGNQDLFAGYREEMRTTSPPNTSHNQHHGSRSNYNGNNRKLWPKHAVVRCGNCGDTGHESAECKTNCRYCGSSEHLSESCPM